MRGHKCNWTYTILSKKYSIIMKLEIITTYETQRLAPDEMPSCARIHVILALFLFFLSFFKEEGGGDAASNFIYSRCLEGRDTTWERLFNVNTSA